jgi:hypothetical protein
VKLPRDPRTGDVDVVALAFVVLGLLFVAMAVVLVVRMAV